MKIILTSDLHCRVDNVQLIADMASDASAKVGGKADALLVLGDVGETPGCFGMCLKKLSRLADYRACIPGNHDLYSWAGVSTDKIANDVLPTIANDNMFAFNPGVTRIGERTLVLMESCWHNLTWRSPGVSASDAEVADAYERRVLDAHRLTTPYRELHARSMLRFKQMLVDLDAVLVDGDSLVVGTHWPIMSESYRPYVPASKRREVNFDDPSTLAPYVSVADAAFMASEFGDVLAEWRSRTRRILSSVKIVSGHTHLGRKLIVDRMGHKFDVEVVQSDYDSPGFIVVESDDVPLHRFSIR